MSQLTVTTITTKDNTTNLNVQTGGAASSQLIVSPTTITTVSPLALSSTLTVTGTTSLNNTTYFNANVAVAATCTLFNGFGVAIYNHGNISTNGTLNLDPSLGNYQYYTNMGAHTINAPTRDTAIDLMMYAGQTSGSPTFSGFTVQSNGTGDPYRGYWGDIYVIMIRRIAGYSTYIIKQITT